MFLVCLFMVILSMGIYAMSVELNAPTSGNWWTSSSSVDHNWTVYTNGSSENIDWCAVLSNETGSWVVLANYTSGIFNATPFTRGISWGDTANNSVKWNVTCSNETHTISPETTFELGVDANPPTVTLDSPTDNFYTNYNKSVLTYTPTDASNPDTCDFYSNITGTWAINNQTIGFASDIAVSVNLSNVTGDLLGDGMNDSTYIWNVMCNDSAANVAWGGANNRSFTVDIIPPTAVVFLSPTNNTVSSNASPLIVWNQTVESNFEKYRFQVSNNLSSFHDGIVQNTEITTISENSTNLANLPANNQYYILVSSVDLAGHEVNSSDIWYYAVDTTAPTVTLSYPASNNTYTTNNSIGFNVTVVDDNPDSCVLYLSNTTTSDLFVNLTDTSITSGAVTTLTPSGIMTDGTYSFRITCNDSDNNRVNSTVDSMNITVDTVSPTDIRINSTWHLINSTDAIPVLYWNQTIDANFGYYLIEARNISDDVIGYAVNVTSISRVFAEMDLSFSETYNFTVRAYDLAGNSVMTKNTTDTWYYTDSICSSLQAGWNLCGIVSTTARNLAVIGNETGASFVSIWNTSKAWKTCNVATQSTNCDIDVGITNTATNTTHVWIYMASAGLWKNRTWSATAESANTTLNNISTNGWNIFSNYIRNGRTFAQLNDTSRFKSENVSMYSKPYNNGTNNVPFITLGGFNTINADTRVEYGEAMWIFYNGTGNSEIFNTNGW